MSDIFLRARHWHIFTLSFAIPFVFQIVAMAVLFSSFSSGNEPDMQLLQVYVKVFPLIILLLLAVYYGWMWSIATGLQKQVPSGIHMKVKKFRIFFFIPIVYFLMLVALFVLFAGNLTDPDFNPDPTHIITFFIVISPLHLFSVFCMFYVMYFAAKTFKTAEYQQEVEFGDFAVEFFLIWFYPLGVWIIQPRINRMVQEKV